MKKFRFQQPVSVRYGDLDPQWHVNNAHFLSFIEYARMNYLMAVGIFDGHSFSDLPLIVGDVHVRYIKPIEMSDKVVVSIGVTRIGTKSMLLECEVTGEGGSPLFAIGENTLVAYDYHTKSAVPVSDEMRAQLELYEGKPFKKGE